MQTHWFYSVWPLIGLGMTIVMLPILLLTNTFRGDTAVSRWRDPQWLMWLAAPFYWIISSKNTACRRWALTTRSRK